MAEAFYSLLSDFIEDLYEEVARFLSEEKRICTSIGFYYGPLVWRLLSVKEKRIASSIYRTDLDKGLKLRMLKVGVAPNPDEIVCRAQRHQMRLASDSTH